MDGMSGNSYSYCFISPSHIIRFFMDSSPYIIWIICFHYILFL